MTKGKARFFYNDDPEQPIKAGGSLLYKVNHTTKDIDLLLIRNTQKDKYEDFGGRVDDQDTCIKETIAREVEEESNRIFKRKNVVKKLRTKNSVYFKNSKYVIFITALSKRHLNIDVSKFGSRETHDCLDRTVEWVPFSKYKQNSFIKSLNFRLKFKELFDKLIQLKRSHFGNSIDATYDQKVLEIPAPDNSYCRIDRNTNLFLETDSDSNDQPVHIKKPISSNLFAQADSA